MLHCLAAASPSHASWLFYYKPEFKGRVIDKETKEPIEGAVVAVYYKKNTYNLGGGSTRVIHTREVLTNKNGEFVIPSYFTIISPFTTSDAAGFIIYKPGYRGYPGIGGLCINPESFLLDERMGTKVECWRGGVRYEFVSGLLELPRLKTGEERLRAMPSTPLVTGSEEFPLLYELINEERRRFGMGEVR